VRPLPEPAERVLTGASSPAVEALARSACALVLNFFPDAVVSGDDKNIGFGTTAGYQGLVFTVAPQRGYVNLGIAHGAGLPDPAHLLRGTGKVHRHVKLHAAAELDRPELRALLKAALARPR
jgi:hypothetical protein